MKRVAISHRGFKIKAVLLQRHMETSGAVKVKAYCEIIVPLWLAADCASETRKEKI